MAALPVAVVVCREHGGEIHAAARGGRWGGRLSGRHAAMVYVDCDLYASTKQVLAFIKRRLVNGMIVCFDNFLSYEGNPNRTSRNALAEFLSANGDLKLIRWFSYNPLGKAFIVRTGDG